MKFEEFIRTHRPLAMVLTVEQYTSIKTLLQEFYSAEDIENIDDFCRFKPPFEKFLLCNPQERSTISTPLMLLNAVTFIDRVSFRNIEFPEEVHLPKGALGLGELQKMDGEPVWVKNLKVQKSFWMLAYPDCVCNRLGYLHYRDYGKEWVAYIRKPQED